MTNHENTVKAFFFFNEIDQLKINDIDNFIWGKNKNTSEKLYL